MALLRHRTRVGLYVRSGFPLSLGALDLDAVLCYFPVRLLASAGNASVPIEGEAK